MSPTNEDFLFAQEAQRRGYVTDVQVEEGLLLQRRMQQELQLDERLAVIMVKRGWIAEEQARRVYARIEPEGDKDEIEGYRLVEKIGHGAMGTVYRAVHLGLQRTVAVKILRRDLGRDETQVERLKEEAKLLASLDHPNIVRAIDAGESRGFPFIVMEYVEGESIKERIARRGAFDEDEALRITRALADALERARRMGVVHRDVKPGNVLLSRAGEPKLMDLGLAKGPVDLGLTQHGTTVGTPQYISPEQAQDPRRADTRSDIYSLGATLYAMLTGRPPFQGTTLAEVITKVLYEAPEPPRHVNRRVSPETSYLVERMMLKDPALRYRTPAEVVRDVDAILAGRSIVPAGFTGNWEAWLLRRRIRRWTKIGLSAAGLLLLLGGGLWFYLRERARLDALAKGEAAVLRVLADSELLAGDDALSTQGKLVDARAAVARWREVGPPGLDRLESRVVALGNEVRYFQDLERLRREVAALLEARRYGEARAKVLSLAERIPGAGGPAERAALQLETDIRQASTQEQDRLTSQALRQSSRSLDELLDQQRAYGDALNGDLVPTPALETARAEIAETLRTLEGIRGDLVRLEEDYAPGPLAPRLESLDLADVAKEFARRRYDLLERGEGAWRRLTGVPAVSWNVVRGHLESRLKSLEARMDDVVDTHARRVAARARELDAARRADEAILLLTTWADACRSAGYPALRADAVDLRSTLVAKRDREIKQAEKDLRAVERDIVDALRRGRAEVARRRIRDALAAVDEAWPRRRELADLEKLPEAWSALADAARDFLLARRDVGGVRLADGTTDRRWIVTAAVPGEPAVIAAPSPGAAPARRELSEVHPDQLVEWAGQGGSPIPPLVRVVARLVSLPDKDPEDLRPLVVALDALLDDFRDAAYEGGIAAAVQERYQDLSAVQEKRERNARAAVVQADFAMTRQEYAEVVWVLGQVLQPGSWYRFTDAFEQNRERIAQMIAKAESEVENLKLASQFPGARVVSDGARTSFAWDFETALQNQSFRQGDARAWAVREPYIGPQETTPDRTNHRLHLLRGMEGLVRDRPLVLPNLFDPAEAISVEFDCFPGRDPFLLLVDVDGVQVAVLSADPTSRAYAERWALPGDVGPAPGEGRFSRVAWYGRGRGVAFHHGRGLGEISRWDWPEGGSGRRHEAWASSRRLGRELFAFEAGRTYRVKVLREGSRLSLFVDGEEVASREESRWGTVGAASDKDPAIRHGTGLIQILTWTPMAIDNLRIGGSVLRKYLEP